MKKCIFLLLLSIFSINRVYAANDNGDECYYIGDGFKASFNYIKNEVYVDVIDDTFDHDKEKMLNYKRPFLKEIVPSNQTATGYYFPYYFEKSDQKLKTCPTYLVVEIGRSCRKWYEIPQKYRVWGTSSQWTAETITKEIDDLPDCIGKYASCEDSNGNRITSEEYYRPFVNEKFVGKEIEKGKECESLFGKKDANGDYFAGTYEYNDKGEKVEIEPPSLGYIIKKVMAYVRIIVPIIVILLGSLDLSKAVIAGKEEDMKKAQSTFIKRILISVVIFFIPALINIIMWIADIAWQGLGYASCTLD